MRRSFLASELDRRRYERGPRGADALVVKDSTRVLIEASRFSEASRAAGAGLHLNPGEWAFGYDRRARVPRILERSSTDPSEFVRLDGPVLEAALVAANAGEVLQPPIQRLVEGAVMSPWAHQGFFERLFVHFAPQWSVGRTAAQPTRDDEG